MNNKRTKQLKNVLIALAGVMIIVSVLISLGYQFSFFNTYNPLYNPYYFVLFSFVIFMAQTRLKEKKTIWNSIGFFERSGLTTMYDVPYEDVNPTHISYTTKDGERHSIKHHHPFAIPSEDGYDNVYLVPKTGVESLDPAKMLKKYGAKLTEQQVSVLNNLKLPEIESLSPDALTTDNTESDDPDTLMQEFDHHVSDIRRGFMGKGKLSENLVYILLGIVVGMAVITFIFMGAGVDFRGVLTR